MSKLDSSIQDSAGDLSENSEVLQNHWLPGLKVESPHKKRTSSMVSSVDLCAELTSFDAFGTSTKVFSEKVVDSSEGTQTVPFFVNEFWTSRQRAAHSLHEISYRACFKPQLPRFFIQRLTHPGQVVYDPFMGRGTTLVEAALLGRVPVGCDVNPLSKHLCRPRLNPPYLEEIEERLRQISWSNTADQPDDLLAFYHVDTLRQISALKHYLSNRQTQGAWDHLDDWICLVALNRLTGHSPGFFSVYTLPPNQAVSVKSQQRINAKRNQIPPVRDVAAIILKKSKALLKRCQAEDRAQLKAVFPKARFLTSSADSTTDLKDASIDLVVTSPPFLNVVDYATDNWLRCWFLGIEQDKVALTTPSKLEDWKRSMTHVLRELNRVLKPGGRVAFEVGEVRKGTLPLDMEVVECGAGAGLGAELVLINDQQFTKTANCWGVKNNAKGTNTNRVVLFRKRN